jgi:hypothetical protein
MNLSREIFHVQFIDFKWFQKWFDVHYFRNDWISLFKIESFALSDSFSVKINSPEIIFKFLTADLLDYS